MNTECLLTSFAAIGITVAAAALGKWLHWAIFVDRVPRYLLLRQEGKVDYLETEVERLESHKRRLENLLDKGSLHIVVPSDAPIHDGDEYRIFGCPEWMNVGKEMVGLSSDKINQKFERIARVRRPTGEAYSDHWNRCQL